MEARGGTVAEPEARAKVEQVFRFLRALNEHRNPATRTIDGQLWALRLRAIPTHESVAFTPPAEPLTPDAEPSDVILRVARPRHTPPPEPPDELRDWLRPSWNDPLSALDFHESRSETTTDGREVLMRFDADPQRVRARAAWSPLREAWAVKETPTRKAGKLFEQLYELYGRIEREAERVELVLGDGALSWRREDGDIFHPLLLQQVQLLFDPSVPEFTVVETGRVPDLYTALLRGIDGIDGKALARSRAEMGEGGFSPLGGDDTNGFLRRLGNVLSASTVFTGDERPAQGAQPPQIGRDPVLFLRARTLGFASAIDGVLEDLATREDLPTSLLRIVGIDAAPPQAEEMPEPAQSWAKPEDVLLSKPANPEQIQLVQRLERYGSVLVQGPPGTGKTHTIANLIGHLLAKQKSVLVTSHTTKALRVLRDHVVPELRPLCVSVLGNDLVSRGQLEEAVTAIADRLSSSSAEELERDAAALATQRHALLKEVSEARTRLLEAQADEYRDVVYGEQHVAPSDAARRLAAERQKDSWIPGPVTPGAPCPLTEGEVIELYASNSVVTMEEEQELAAPLLTPHELITPQELAERIARSRAETDVAAERRELWRPPPADASQASLASLKERCVAAMELLDATGDWRLEVIAAGAAGPEAIGTWKTLLELVATVRQQANASRELLLKYAPEVETPGDVAEHLHVARAIRQHLKGGKSLGGFALFLHGAWKRLVTSSRVVGGQPRTEEHFAALEAALQLRLLREELCGRWDRQVAIHGGPASKDLGPAPEESCAQLTEDISRCLAWADAVWAPIQGELERVGFAWKRLVDEQPPNFAPHGALLRLKDAVRGPVVAALGARARELGRKEAEEALAGALRKLDEWGGARAQSQTVGQLVVALQGRDEQRYAAAFARMVELHSRNAVLERRRSLLARLESSAPTWASELRQRFGVHAGSEPPGDVEAAWEWRQLYEELERRARIDLTALQQAIEAKSTALRWTTGRLIECRTWLGQVRRTTLPQRQALEGWLQLVRKIGKGTGKRAPRLRVEAARKMSECRDAVPVWVMPLAEVVANFDATTRFDCIIIDEASQSDVMALTAMYMARNVVVVGDHEQVSPSAVGQKLEVVSQLIDEHLQGIPNRLLYDGQTSVYDLAKSSFGGLVCLTEHFRCVPDIIEFSNQLSYGGRIKPLRESGSTSLKPALNFHRVEGQAKAKVNAVEASALAALVVAAHEHAAYAGKSFGVISLVGEEQANEVDRILRERLHPADYERRRILCGNAAEFQGDERDVMFLSMVDSPQEGPLPLRAEQRFKQRFNVAVSRARDQLWVVHSLDADVDLKPGDLRRRLIEHCVSPFAGDEARRGQEERRESPLEREVHARLVGAGFRVARRREVGRFRIDFVVEGAGARLAVECDGDRYRTLDRLSEDMARQAILERLGWRFARVRGSAFFREPDASMAAVFSRFAELGIAPEGAAPVSAGVEDRKLREEVLRRAAELERLWREEDAGA